MGQRVETRPSIGQDDWWYNAAAGGIVNTTNTAVQAAPNTAYRVVCTGISVQNISAVASEWTLRDAAGGTILMRGVAPASMTTPAVFMFKTPLKTSPGNTLSFAMGTTATQTYVNAQGYFST